MNISTHKTDRELVESACKRIEKDLGVHLCTPRRFGAGAYYAKFYGKDAQVIIAVRHDTKEIRYKNRQMSKVGIYKMAEL